METDVPLTRGPCIFILGAAKSGSTTIARWLSRHSNMLLAEPKEPTFFEYEYYQGLGYYWRTYFEGHWDGEQTFIDARHRNLYLPFIPPRIEQSVLDPYFVVTLREPVSRAHAHWWHWRARKREPLSFEDAIAKDLERLEAGVELTPELWAEDFDREHGTNSMRTYLDTGFYAEQITRYASRFGRGRMAVVFLDEWESNVDVLQAALNSMGFETPEAPPGHHNPGKARVTFRRGIGFARWAERKAAPVPIPPKMRAIVRKYSRKNIETRPPIAPETRVELMKFYEPHNRLLEGLIGRKLPTGWG